MVVSQKTCIAVRCFEESYSQPNGETIEVSSWRYIVVDHIGIDSCKCGHICT